MEEIRDPLQGSDFRFVEVALVVDELAGAPLPFCVIDWPFSDARPFSKHRAGDWGTGREGSNPLLGVGRGGSDADFTRRCRFSDGILRELQGLCGQS